MSTYLVAFIVGNFDFVEGYTENIRVRIYTPVGKSEQGNFALEVTYIHREYSPYCLYWFVKTLSL